MNQAVAKSILKPLGVTFTAKAGEYRVNILGGTESTAYYTSSIDDAVNTGKHMAAHEDARRQTAKAAQYDTLELANALKVFVYNPDIRYWLTRNDPKALEQARKALKLIE